MLTRGLVGCCLLLLALAVPVGAAKANYLAPCDVPRLPYFVPPSENWLSQSDRLVPGLSWDGWRILLGLGWTKAELQSTSWFDADQVAAAAARVPLDTPFPGGVPQSAYAPLVPATAAQKSEYEEAAARYRGGDWTGAIAAFDAIAGTTSPYAAAAAYSAARAALNAADFAGGIHRIGRLLADPADREMHQAAHHLLGTLAYQTGAGPLIAARLAEMTHLLTTPPELRCSDLELRVLAEEADRDLSYVLDIAFPSDDLHISESWPQHTRDVIDRLAADDEIVDLIRVLAASTPFRGTFWRDPFLPDQVRYPGHRLYDQAFLTDADPDPDATTAHARERAKTTGNPLWAYALARRTTDVNDLPLIRAARRTITGSALAQPDQVALNFDLALQEARLLLTAGRIDEAITAIGTARMESTTASQVAWQEAWEAGIRLLISHRDLASARRWAQALFPWHDRFNPAPSEFAPLLATTWQELLAPGIGPNPARERLRDDEASALDLLPAARLASLARTPGLVPGWRRPILSAAWIRFYMLDRDREFAGLIPDIRASFPELSGDLDVVASAWTPWTRRRLVVRMLLRHPGLSPRVLWARNLDPYASDKPQPTITRIDSFNPNDGNWWCAIDPARAARDAFGQVLADPLSADFWIDKDSFDSLHPTSGDEKLPSGTLSIDDLARRWLAWHPLLRQADWDELQRLSHVESGPRRLAEAAVNWSRHSYWITRLLGMDRGLPETLALAVRATRYGCRRQGKLGDVSRAAWEALQRDYGDTAWARITPYWFDLGG